MNLWKNIYEASGQIGKDVLRRTEKENPEAKENEPGIRFLTEETLSHRLLRQEKYDGIAAYRRLRAHRRRLMVRRYSVAAGILLITTLAVGWLWRNQEETAVVKMVHQQSPIQPGGKKAVLTLASGTVVNIQDSVLSLHDIEKRLHEDSVCQHVAPSGTSVELAYHTLAVPRGGEFYLTLPDSTRVWLNSETELRFPAQFAANFRSVILKGEAYFEVAHEKNRPFLVHLDAGMITVYGTQFCVSAYEQSDLVATLVEGSIGFRAPKGEKVRLRPSQQVVYTPETEHLTVREVDPQVYTSWKDQLFTFEDQSLEEIMKTLARWYDVDILFESSQLKQLKMSGTLDKYENVEPLLKIFEAGQKVYFEIGEKTIVVRQKR